MQHTTRYGLIVLTIIMCIAVLIVFFHLREFHAKPKDIQITQFNHVQDAADTLYDVYIQKKQPVVLYHADPSTSRTEIQDKLKGPFGHFTHTRGEKPQEKVVYQTLSHAHVVYMLQGECVLRLFVPQPLSRFQKKPYTQAYDWKQSTHVCDTSQPLPNPKYIEILLKKDQAICIPHHLKYAFYQISPDCQVEHVVQYSIFSILYDKIIYTIKVI